MQEPIGWQVQLVSPNPSKQADIESPLAFHIFPPEDAESDRMAEIRPL
jgi:hypothetical protein